MRNDDETPAIYDQFEVQTTRPDFTKAVGALLLVTLAWFAAVFFFTLVVAVSWGLMLWTWGLVW